MSKMEYSYRIMAQIYISTNFFYLFTIRNLFFKYSIISSRIVNRELRYLNVFK